MQVKRWVAVAGLTGSLAVGSVVGALTFAPTAGLAQEAPQGGQDQGGPTGPGPEGQGGCHLDVVAEAIGIDEDALAEQLRDGSTIAEVAEANGVDVDAVVDAMVADATEHIQKDVEDGRLTQEQADEKLAELEEHISGVVSGEIPPGPPPGMGYEGAPQAGGTEGAPQLGGTEAGTGAFGPAQGSFGPPPFGAPGEAAGTTGL